MSIRELLERIQKEQNNINFNDFIKSVEAFGYVKLMKKYAFVVFYSEEDNKWIANVPDIEYFSAFGKTPTAAVKELEASLKNWYAVVKEGNLPMPEANFDPSKFEAAPKNHSLIQ